MNPIQQAIANRNKKIVIGVGIIFAGLWVLLVMYVIADSEKDYHIVQPGTVTVQPSAPGVNSSSVATYHPTHSHPLFHHLTTGPQTVSYTAEAPKASMGSTSMRLFQTSDATAHNIGGGGNGGIIATTNGGLGNGSRGVNYTALAYSGAIYIPTTFNAVTTVGAPNAKMMAKLVTPEETPEMSGPRRVGSDPLDPFLDPVGEVVWPLMVLLVGTYSYVIYRRRKTTNSGV